MVSRHLVVRVSCVLITRGMGKSKSGRELPIFPSTYRITNLRGLKESTGKSVKQITKQARAARLQAAKTINRSHRLTVALVVSQEHHLSARHSKPITCAI